jgi:fucose 4-O-acetylase-like acetyltransferase
MDNAKSVLIVLVVFGHLLELNLKPYSWNESIYFFVYLFHIPAFVYISGYFSNAELFSQKAIRRVFRLFCTYACFQGIYHLWKFYITSHFSLEESLLYPYWLMWYLMSLITWNLLLPMFCRYPYSIVLAVLSGVAVGYLVQDGSLLSIGRSFVFFPFFLAGFRHSKMESNNNFPIIAKLIAASSFICIALTSNIIQKHLNYRWLYGRISFSELGMPNWQGGVTRLGIYLLSSLLLVSFFILLPKKRYWFSDLGKFTLPVFLWHGLIIKILSHFHPLKFPSFLNSFLVAFGFSLALVLLLSREFFAKLTEGDFKSIFIFRRNVNF